MSSTDTRLEEVRTLLADVLDLDVDKITEDAHFVDELDVDSLMALEVMVTLEKRFKVKIPERELAQITCLRNVMQLLETKGVL